MPITRPSRRCSSNTTPSAKTPHLPRRSGPWRRSICRALSVHAQIEEEIFYPAVRKVIGDDGLMDEALAEHAEAKELIAEIQGMKATSANQDAR